MIDVFWRISHSLYKNKLHCVARIFEYMSMCVSSHAVSAQIKVGKGTCFYHHALGCTFLQTVEIGKNCKIFPNVTIGYAFSKNKKYYGGGVIYW